MQMPSFCWKNARADLSSFSLRRHAEKINGVYEISEFSRTFQSFTVRYDIQ